MKKLKKLYLKIYLYFGEFLIPTKRVNIPPFLKRTRNLFIYFDYEREFGGHNTNITDENITNILDLLERYQIKSTWFTVGKIFEKYPDSISAILRKGHEMGSHTYSHNALFKMTSREMKSDFELFTQSSNMLVRAKGFHAPKGQWRLNMFKHLFSNDFMYDLSGGTWKNNGTPLSLFSSRKERIIRLKTVGDDWPMYLGGYKENEVLEYLIQLTNKIDIGEISGIGFHPWVLSSNKNILNGFILFLDFLHNQDNYVLGTGLYFVEQLRMNHKGIKA